MLVRNFRFFLLCSLSVVFLFSCGSDIEENEFVEEEAVTRDIEPGLVFATATDTCKPNRVGGSTYHKQKLDLTGKDLSRQSGESVEDFLTRLGFNKDVLCTGGCVAASKTCTVTNVFNSINSDLAAIHANGDSKIIRKFYPRSDNQDMSCVSVKIRAICKCK